jgi:3-oxoacyl-[acyl-carrier protein] reductase
VLDERAVAEHVDAVAPDAGGIDIALDAVSFPHVQGTLFAELAVEDVMHPIDTFLRTNLITAKAVARHMTARRSGTILTLSTAGSRHAPPGVLGYEIAGSALVDLIRADPATTDPGYLLTRPGLRSLP